MTKMNPVTKPRHYQFDGEIKEVRDVIRERTEVYLDNDLPVEGIYDYNNAIKYILRGPAKNGIEDFKKARYCIDSLIDVLEDYPEPPYEYGDSHVDACIRLGEAMRNRLEEVQYPVVRTGTIPQPPHYE